MQAMRVRGLAARFGLAALLALLGQPAAAGLTPKDLSGVGLAPPPARGRRSMPPSPMPPTDAA